MSDKIKKGKAGEMLAEKFLIEKGYVVRERNYRYRKAEIDLIVQQGQWLVFVEVKARSSTAFGHPESFVDRKKVQNVLMAADDYIHKINWQGQVRYDVVSISLRSAEDEVRHFEDAFY